MQAYNAAWNPKGTKDQNRPDKFDIPTIGVTHIWRVTVSRPCGMRGANSYWTIPMLSRSRGQGTKQWRGTQIASGCAGHAQVKVYQGKLCRDRYLLEWKRRDGHISSIYMSKEYWVCLGRPQALGSETILRFNMYRCSLLHRLIVMSSRIANQLVGTVYHITPPSCFFVRKAKPW